MASSSRYFTILLILGISLHIIYATEFIIGDAQGWTLGFDSQAWIEGKEFHEGYKLGSNNVAPASDSTEALDPGNDEIILSSHGRKWHICDIAKHCESGGLKLAITVNDDSSAFSPFPTPTSAAATTTSLLFYSSWTMLVFGFFAVILG